jgi:hypothetical protein
MYCWWVKGVGVGRSRSFAEISLASSFPARTGCDDNTVGRFNYTTPIHLHITGTEYLDYYDNYTGVS